MAPPSFRDISSYMRYLFVILGTTGLLILHQNYFIWERDDLIGGFLPFQLAYDGALSIVTSLVWLIAVMMCWPTSSAVETRHDEETEGQRERSR